MGERETLGIVHEQRDIGHGKAVGSCCSSDLPQMADFEGMPKEPPEAGRQPQQGMRRARTTGQEWWRGVSWLSREQGRQVITS
jgi:hypothetical protein